MNSELTEKNAFKTKTYIVQDTLGHAEPTEHTTDAVQEPAESPDLQELVYRGQGT